MRRLRPAAQEPTPEQLRESVWVRAWRDAGKRLTGTVFGLVFLGLLGAAFGGVYGVLIAFATLFGVHLLLTFRVQRNEARLVLAERAEHELAPPPAIGLPPAPTGVADYRETIQTEPTPTGGWRTERHTETADLPERRPADTEAEIDEDQEAPRGS